MKYNKVIENLMTLKLDKMAESLSEYVDKINEKNISFLEVLYDLTKLEIEYKAQRASEFNIRIAHFSYYKTFAKIYMNIIH